MGSQPPADERHIDHDGVTRIQKPRSSPGTWIIGLALGFTVLCVLASLWLLSPAPTTADPPPAPLARTAPLTPESPLPASRPQAPLPPARPTVPTSGVAPAAPSEPIPEAPQPQAPAEGLHLYRQGTKPLKQGLVVPEGFTLPPGYVRHYQSTDNGEQLKPILMFHEDYKPVDAQGRPIELPTNRVVPPEMAPPGMPLDVIELPKGPEGVEPIP